MVSMVLDDWKVHWHYYIETSSPPSANKHIKNQKKSCASNRTRKASRTPPEGSVSLCMVADGNKEGNPQTKGKNSTSMDKKCINRVWIKKEGTKLKN